MRGLSLKAVGVLLVSLFGIGVVVSDTATADTRHSRRPANRAVQQPAAPQAPVQRQVTSKHPATKPSSTSSASTQTKSPLSVSPLNWNFRPPPLTAGTVNANQLWGAGFGVLP